MKKHIGMRKKTRHPPRLASGGNAKKQFLSSHGRPDRNVFINFQKPP